MSGDQMKVGDAISESIMDEEVDTTDTRRTTDKSSTCPEIIVIPPAAEVKGEQWFEGLGIGVAILLVTICLFFLINTMMDSFRVAQGSGFRSYELRPLTNPLVNNDEYTQSYGQQENTRTKRSSRIVLNMTSSAGQRRARQFLWFFRSNTPSSTMMSLTTTEPTTIVPPPSSTTVITTTKLDILTDFPDGSVNLNTPNFMKLILEIAKMLRHRSRGKMHDLPNSRRDLVIATAVPNAKRLVAVPSETLEFQPRSNNAIFKGHDFSMVRRPSTDNFKYKYPIQPNRVEFNDTSLIH